MTATERPKLAMYWAASCGGCEVSLANIHEAILEVDRHFDFIFCPCLLDGKRADIEALPDGAIAVTLFNGALRTAENLDMARLLRQKSRLLIAFGSCAVSGGIPALANQHGLQHLLETVYRTSPTLDNPQGLVPQPVSHVAAGELELPPFLPRVLALDQAVVVDYGMPGCPPEPEQIVALIRQLASGAPLPPPCSLLGCSARAVCDDCPREKRGVLTPQLLRSCALIPEPGWCLLEQGIPCVGSATRGGCAALCPSVAMPCTGCYGPLDLDADPGAAALTAIAAAIRPPAVELLAAGGAARPVPSVGLTDPLGSLYRYTLAASVVADRKPERQP